jgi:hypothetical protein
MYPVCFFEREPLQNEEFAADRGRRANLACLWSGHNALKIAFRSVMRNVPKPPSFAEESVE